MGLMGILFTPYRDWFVNNTPLVLLIMFLLLSKSQMNQSKKYIVFFLIAFMTGMITEIIGVNTGLLFGHYQYSNVFGLKLFGVPLLIGLNWFIIVTCADSFFNQNTALVQQKINLNISKKALVIYEIVGGAIIATCFDIILEPVAIELNFWTWENAQVPVSNYICWFLISTALLAVNRYFKMLERNPFATILFIIQGTFFLILNLLLPYFK